MKILLIINAHSGTKNSKSQLLDAMDVFSRYGHKTTVYVTQKVNDAYEYLLKNRIKYDAVCVFGGDGTLNEVSNALMHCEHKPMIGYFPSGTMNDFGSNYDLGADFRSIAEKICNSEGKTFDVGKFGEHYFNYVAAFGAFCDVPFKTDRSAKETFGTLAYIFEGISRIPSIEPVPVKYTIKGHTKKTNALFGLVFSGGRVAGVQLVDKKRSKMDDGMFNVLIVEYAESIFDTLDYLSMMTQPSKYFHMFKAEEIEFEFEGKTIWTLDGEEATVDKSIKIENIQNALTILA